ncbi:MAG: hypothetical protein HUU55_15385 [Myxococcales bacterium]|nr:hypothetical protein [Myxococcales bacterium]
MGAPSQDRLGCVAQMENRSQKSDILPDRPWTDRGMSVHIPQGGLGTMRQKAAFKGIFVLHHTVLGVVLLFRLTACAPDVATATDDDFVDGVVADSALADSLGLDLADNDGGSDVAEVVTADDSWYIRDTDTDDYVPDLAEGVGDTSFPVIAATEPISAGNFATSGVCKPCHSVGSTSSAMKDSAGRNVSPFDLWQSSMKANSARDPFWRAAVSVEMALFPEKRTIIEEKCTWCHTPMAAYHAKQNALAPPKLTDIGADSAIGQLAADGVSCTLCHGITSEGLGTEESFVGGFHLATGKTLFGQHGDLFVTPMLNQSGFTPQKASHLRSSALCGTCHTLITHALDGEGGESRKPFFEQTSYLEWRNSAYSTETPQPSGVATDCFGCHIPETDEDTNEIVTKVARRPDGGDFPPLKDRDQYGRHLFVGGNTLVVGMIRDNRDKLNPGVPKEAFDATIAAARKQLSEQTASLEWLNVDLSASMLALDVKITNRTGHKLPTGYPSRRVFLRLEVRSPGGKILLSSGETNQHGQILGKSGQPLPSERLLGPALEHGNIISDVDTPPIWETVIADSEGKITFSLLKAAEFLKDNRILPQGWDNGYSGIEDIAPVGVVGDDDFGAGQDVVHYRLPLDEPLPKGTTIGVTAFYQVIKPRQVEELRATVTPETVAFGTAWDKADRAPEQLAAIKYVVD